MIDYLFCLATFYRNNLQRSMVDVIFFVQSSIDSFDDFFWLHLFFNYNMCHQINIVRIDIPNMKIMNFLDSLDIGEMIFHLYQIYTIRDSLYQNMQRLFTHSSSRFDDHK